jgi:2'-5' RNA ligase
MPNKPHDDSLQNAIIHDSTHKAFLNPTGVIFGYGQEHEDTIRERLKPNEGENDEEFEERIDQAINDLINNGTIRLCGYQRPNSPVFVQLTQYPTEAQKSVIGKAIRNQGGIIFDIRIQGINGISDTGEATLPGEFWRKLDYLFGRKTKTSSEYKYPSTQIDLPRDLAKKVLAAGAAIPDEDLGKDGREEHPHITVKYGTEEDVKELREAIKNFPQFEVVLGSSKFFPPRNEDGTPIVIEVELSDKLQQLHDLVLAAIGLVEDEFPYDPHVTLAYVKDDVAKKYVGIDTLKGEKFTVK